MTWIDHHLTPFKTILCARMCVCVCVRYHKIRCGFYFLSNKNHSRAFYSIKFHIFWFSFLFIFFPAIFLQLVNENSHSWRFRASIIIPSSLLLWCAVIACASVRLIGLNENSRVIETMCAASHFTQIAKSCESRSTKEDTANRRNHHKKVKHIRYSIGYGDGVDLFIWSRLYYRHRGVAAARLFIFRLGSNFSIFKHSSQEGEKKFALCSIISRSSLEVLFDWMVHCLRQANTTNGYWNASSSACMFAHKHKGEKANKYLFITETVFGDVQSNTRRYEARYKINLMHIESKKTATVQWKWHTMGQRNEFRKYLKRRAKQIESSFCRIDILMNFFFSKASASLDTPVHFLFSLIIIFAHMLFPFLCLESNCP